MKKDPFASIIEMMRAQGAKYNAPPMKIAKVTSQLPDIKIKLGDIEIGKENLLIADYLLDSYKRKIKIPETITITGETNVVGVGDHGSHKHDVTKIAFDGELQLTDSFMIGDIVAVMPIDEQTFIILARVVSL